jgi:hypothetical protein
MIRLGLILWATALPAAAQDFAFRQDCTLTLQACDVERELNDGNCPIGHTATARFYTEGDAFYLSADGLGNDAVDDVPKLFFLGQGYFTDAIRIYYFKRDPVIDGMFWIAADGNSGAQLYREGLEDYFTAVCTPLPD